MTIIQAASPILLIDHLTRRPPLAQKWPTFIIEAGVSQSLPALSNKAHWWLNSSRAEIKLIIVMSIQKKGIHIGGGDTSSGGDGGGDAGGRNDQQVAKYLDVEM
ncbi:hypothetical protein B7463_g793, partial [Scytalidium lignicola]